MTEPGTEVDSTDPSVHSHLAILQQVIQRMSSNSAASKAWCIALVSALLVLIVEKNNRNLIHLALIPTFLFFVLDAYYLALERGFIASYNEFIRKVHTRELRTDDLYCVSPTGNVLLQILKALLSFSVWPFYLVLLLMIYLSKGLLM